MLRDHLQEIQDLYRSGQTYQQIGDKFGVSRQRIQQVIGLNRTHGGQHVKKAKRLQSIADKREAWAQSHLGISYAKYRELLQSKGYRSPLGAFRSQKINARRRGIAWEMTFADWWRIWDVSGKWSQRGRGQGYVMARKGDTGPYSVDNVYIATSSQNIKDSYIFRPYHLRNNKHLRRHKTGEPTPRHTQIIELRSQGLKWDEVGARLGITGNGACAYYGQAMREAKSHSGQAA